MRRRRFALAIELGRPLESEEVALREVCDHPICVRASEAVARTSVRVAGIGPRRLAGDGAGNLVAQQHPDTVLADIQPIRDRVSDRYEGERVGENESSTGACDLGEGGSLCVSRITCRYASHNPPIAR